MSLSFLFVIPAKAGVSPSLLDRSVEIPAFAGMTNGEASVYRSALTRPHQPEGGALRVEAVHRELAAGNLHRLVGDRAAVRGDRGVRAVDVIDADIVAPHRGGQERKRGV